jgi:hypothetical protein
MPGKAQRIVLRNVVAEAIDSEGFVTAIRACGLAGSSVAKGMKKISYKGYRFPPEII